MMTLTYIVSNAFLLNYSYLYLKYVEVCTGQCLHIRKFSSVALHCHLL